MPPNGKKIIIKMKRELMPKKLERYGKINKVKANFYEKIRSAVAVLTSIGKKFH